MWMEPFAVAQVAIKARAHDRRNRRHECASPIVLEANIRPKIGNYAREVCRDPTETVVWGLFWGVQTSDELMKNLVTAVRSGLPTLPPVLYCFLRWPVLHCTPQT